VSHIAGLITTHTKRCICTFQNTLNLGSLHQLLNLKRLLVQLLSQKLWSLYQACAFHLVSAHSAHLYHAQAPTATVATTDGFKPTRRVRTVPGGPSTDIFGNSVDDGVLAMAPPKDTKVRLAATIALHPSKNLYHDFHRLAARQPRRFLSLELHPLLQ
jgi:hypothetical protein